MSAAQSPVPVQDPKLVPVPVPAPPRRPRSRTPFVWLLILAVAGSIAAWWAARPQTQTKAPVEVARTATAGGGNIERTVRLSGQTAATDFVNITAPMMKGPEASREMILNH